MEEVEVIEYKGKEIKVYYDEDSQDPRDWDNLGTMCCWHRHYSLGDEQPNQDHEEFLEELAMSASSEYAEAKERLEDIEHRLGGWHWSEGDNEMVPSHAPLWWKAVQQVQRMKDVALESYVILPLYLYDHSGITMNTSGFSCGWDSGQVGFIYCSLEDAQKAFGAGTIGGWDTIFRGDERYDGKTLRDLTIRALEAEVEAYDHYISGQVYGWEAGDDSCWDYYGSDHKASGLLEAAQAAVDYQIKEEEKMNDKTKHTPGPWAAGSTSNPRAILKIQRNGTALPIAHMNKSLWDENNPRRIADLALLAAAPELLNALETLYYAHSDDESDYPNRQLFKIVMDAKEKARQAIAKVKAA
jgi:hypothetical protein